MNWNRLELIGINQNRSEKIAIYRKKSGKNGTNRKNLPHFLFRKEHSGKKGKLAVLFLINRVKLNPISVSEGKG